MAEEVVQSVFVHIPKTAGQAIAAAIRGHDAIENIEHRKLEPRHRTRFTFGFVRHPETRLRSAFFHMVAVPAAMRGQENFHRRRVRLAKEFGRDFERFVLERGFERYDFPHFQSQLIFEPLAFDFLGRFESLNEDWRRLCERIRLPHQPLQIRNVTRYPDGGAGVSDAVRAVIRKAFAEDFKQLGYV